MDLHRWVFKLEAWRSAHGKEGGEVNASSELVAEYMDNVGAVIMGRQMFGPGSGPWGEDPWRGWWGEDPPFHVPVFVLTHHEREPLQMEGGTTFHFVTDGIESALQQAEAAGDGEVRLGGGASAARQYLAAGLLDELQLNVVPILLGDGERLFDGVAGGDFQLEPVRALGTPEVTHIRYRVS